VNRAPERRGHHGARGPGPANRPAVSITQRRAAGVMGGLKLPSCRSAGKSRPVEAGRATRRPSPSRSRQNTFIGGSRMRLPVVRSGGANVSVRPCPQSARRRHASLGTPRSTPAPAAGEENTHGEQVTPRATGDASRSRSRSHSLWPAWAPAIHTACAESITCRLALTAPGAAHPSQPTNRDGSPARQQAPAS
jgi:hypothetical protein